MKISFNKGKIGRIKNNNKKILKFTYLTLICFKI